MEFDTIAVRVDGDRGELVLDRPEKLNPLSTHTLGEIEAAARWFDGHDELKVVVVSGRGRCFSAGADVSAFGAVEGGVAGASPRDDADAGWRMARAMDAMRAVTVAKLHGWCVGGGLVLAATCDLRIAAESARFSIPEVELGIPLAWGGIPRLVREIGPALTKELVMTCREFGPEEAKAAGFLNRVVPDAELDDAVASLVANLRADATARPAGDQGPHQRGHRGDGRHRPQLVRRRRSAGGPARPRGPGLGGRVPGAGAVGPEVARAG